MTCPKSVQLLSMRSAVSFTIALRTTSTLQRQVQADVSLHRFEFKVESQVCDKLCDKCTYDGSVLVRMELVAAIQWFIIDFENRFVEVFNELDKRFKPKDGLDEVGAVV